MADPLKPGENPEKQADSREAVNILKAAEEEKAKQEALRDNPELYKTTKETALKRFIAQNPKETSSRNLAQMYARQDEDFRKRLEKNPQAYEKIFQDLHLEVNLDSQKSHQLKALTAELKDVDYLNQETKDEWVAFFKERMVKAETPDAFRVTEKEMQHFLDETTPDYNRNSRNLGFYLETHEKFHAKVTALKESKFDQRQLDQFLQRFERAGGSERKRLVDEITNLADQFLGADQTPEAVNLEERAPKVREVVRAIERADIFPPDTKREWITHFEKYLQDEKTTDAEFQKIVDNFLSDRPNAEYNSRNLAFYREQHKKFYSEIDKFAETNPEFPKDRLDLLRLRFKEAGGSKRTELQKELTLLMREYKQQKEAKESQANFEIQKQLASINTALDQSPYISAVTRQRSKDYFRNKFKEYKGEKGLEEAKKSLERLTSKTPGSKEKRNLATYEIQYKEFQTKVAKYSAEHPELAARFKEHQAAFDRGGMQDRTMLMTQIENEYLSAKRTNENAEKQLEAVKAVYLNRIDKELRDADYLSPKTKKHYLEFFQERYDKPQTSIAQIESDFRAFTSNVPNEKIKNLAAYRQRHEKFSTLLEEKRATASPEDQKALDRLEKTHAESGWNKRKEAFEELEKIKDAPKPAAPEELTEELPPEIEDVTKETGKKAIEQTDKTEEPNPEAPEEVEAEEPAPSALDKHLKPAAIEELRAKITPEAFAQADQRLQFLLAAPAFRELPADQVAPFLFVLASQLTIGQFERLVSALQTAEEGEDPLAAPELQSAIEASRKISPEFAAMFEKSLPVPPEIIEEPPVDTEEIEEELEEEIEEPLEEMEEELEEPLEEPLEEAEEPQEENEEDQEETEEPEEELTEESEELSEETDQTPEQTEEPTEEVDQNLEATEEPLEENEQSQEEAEEPLEQVDQTAEESEQPLETTEQTTEAIDQPLPEAHQTIDENGDIVDLPVEEPPSDDETFGLEEEPEPLVAQPSENANPTATTSTLNEKTATTLPPEFRAAAEPNIFDEMQAEVELQDAIAAAEIPEPELEEEVTEILEAPEGDNRLPSQKLLEALFTGNLNKLPPILLDRLVRLTAQKDVIQKTVKQLEGVKHLRIETTGLPLFMLFSFLFQIHRDTDIATYLRAFTQFAATYLGIKIDFTLEADDKLRILCFRKPLDLFKWMLTKTMELPNINAIRHFTYRLREISTYLEVSRVHFTFEVTAERPHLFSDEIFLVTEDYAKTV